MTGFLHEPVHGGNILYLVEQTGLDAEALVDFSANINPLGPPEWLRPVLSVAVSRLVHYPDRENTRLVEAAARRYGVAPEEVVAGNGSTELIRFLPQACQAKRVVVLNPCYSDYAHAARLAGLSVVGVALSPERDYAVDFEALEAVLRPGDLVFLGRPNNPTGSVFDAESLRNLAARRPETFFAVDEAFADFVAGLERCTERRPHNVAVLLSLTKFYALPGLRLGCAVMDRELAGRLRGLIPTWSVNTLAQEVGCQALLDTDYADRTCRFVMMQRENLEGELRGIPGLTVFPGQANFLLIRIERKDLNSRHLTEKFLKQGIAVRDCSSFEGLEDRHIRVAVRGEEENARLVEALRMALGSAEKRCVSRRRTPCLMIQGTASNAGKSVLTAAFCRILLQDGVKVAPFKAQNMSLNSFVTLDGGEMGRAQVVQAAACRLDPDVRMNPVLLKPNSDTGSQVIVNGKPVGNMNVGEYVRYKPEAFEAVKRAYDSLASEHEAVVLEGAGSPGEVNLKRHDIVNMGMARYAGAPVLLAGDIDRGGVFASFVGTMEVLAEWERRLVKGFLVNRFRGQASLLQDAFDYVERHTGLPTLGVVPYLNHLNLPQEDSVEFKSGALDGGIPEGEHVEVAVLDLPHISNFTDFDPLRLEPDVRVRVVRRGDVLGNPDAVILPGSKNVTGDLVYLRAQGLDRAIVQLARQGECEVVGICGGLQILGRSITDPSAIESSGGSVAGVGLLNVETELAVEKTLKQVWGTHVDSGLEVRGYEIHHGRTAFVREKPCIRTCEGDVIGAQSGDGLVWGTYLHGVFDSDAFRRWFLDGLRRRKGLPPLGGGRVSYDLEPALDRLATVVRDSVRMDEIYRIMGL